MVVKHCTNTRITTETRYKEGGGKLPGKDENVPRKDENVQYIEYRYLEKMKMYLEMLRLYLAKRVMERRCANTATVPPNSAPAITSPG